MEKKSLLAFFRLNGQRDSIGNPLRKALPLRLPPFPVREAERSGGSRRNRNKWKCFVHFHLERGGLLRGSQRYRCGRAQRYFYIPFAGNSRSRLILARRAAECTRKVSEWAMHSLMSWFATSTLPTLRVERGFGRNKLRK